LGLPSWSEVKVKEALSTRIQHITAFYQIFTVFFPENATHDEPIVNLINEMKNCSNNQINMDSIVKSILDFNFLDDVRDID
jgi:hypothetical protein